MYRGAVDHPVGTRGQVCTGNAGDAMPTVLRFACLEGYMNPARYVADAVQCQDQKVTVWAEFNLQIALWL